MKKNKGNLTTESVGQGKSGSREPLSQNVAYFQEWVEKGEPGSLTRGGVQKSKKRDSRRVETEIRKERGEEKPYTVWDTANAAAKESQRVGRVQEHLAESTR